MGIKERQDREREAVRRAILDAARDLFVRDGYRNVSIRKIADKIEYSPAAIYSYFPSKDDLFFALAEEGFQLFFTTSSDPDQTSADALEAVRRAFWHYYEFSRSQPEYFELMFVDRSVPRISRDWERFGFFRQKLQQLRDKIGRCIEAGLLPATLDPSVALHILWAATHGVSVIRLCDRMSPREDPDALMRDTFEAALAGLQAGIVTTFCASECEAVNEVAADRTEPEGGTARTSPDRVGSENEQGSVLS